MTKRAICGLAILLFFAGCRSHQEVGAPQGGAIVTQATPANSSKAEPLQVVPTEPVELGAELHGERLTRGTKEIQPPTLSESLLTLAATAEPLQDLVLEGESRTLFESFGVQQKQRTLKSEALSGFLPDDSVQVGQTWKVRPGPATELLSQISDTVTESLDRDAQGTYALLRAQSDQYLEIAFRAHAQFLLSGDVTYTPAQFDGRLLIDRNTGDVSYLSVAVPTQHSRNVNYESRLGGEFAVGMAYLPRMEIVGGSPELAEAVEWAEEMPHQEARTALARKFFAFEHLAWLPPDKALVEARAQNKPIMAIVIEGVLNDQSC